MILTPRMLFAVLVAGLLLLALGRGVGNDRSARESGMEPLALLLKAMGLGLLAWGLYRYIAQNR